MVWSPAQRQRYIQLYSQLKTRQMSRNEFLLQLKREGIPSDQRRPSVEGQILGKEFDRQKAEQEQATAQEQKVEAARQQARENLRPVGAPTVSEKLADQLAIRQALPIATSRIPLDREVTITKVPEQNIYNKEQISKQNGNTSFVSRGNIGIASDRVDMVLPQAKVSKERSIGEGLSSSGKEFRQHFTKTVKEIVVSPVKGIGKILYDPFETGKPIADIGQEKYLRVAGGRKNLLSDTDVQAAIGTTALFAAPAKVQSLVYSGLLGSKVIKYGLKPSAGNLGEVAALAILPKATESVMGLKGRILGEKALDVSLEPYYNPKTNEPTFVGKGEYLGKPAEAVLTSKGKLFLKTEGEPVSFPASGKEMKGLNVKSRPVERSILLERDTGRAVTEEIFKTDVFGTTKIRKAEISADLKITDLIKSKVMVSPEITKVTKITPSSKEITYFEANYPELEFGKGKRAKNILEIESTKEGTFIKEIKPASATSLGFRARTGEGSLRILVEEKPMDFGAMGRSKRASLLFERQKSSFSSPKFFLEESTAPGANKMKFPDISIAKQSTKFFFSSGLNFNMKNKSKAITKSSLDVSLGKKIGQKPTTAQQPKIKINTKANTSLIPKSASIFKVQSKQKIKFGAMTAFNTNMKPSFNIPSPSPKVAEPKPAGGLNLSIPHARNKRTAGLGFKFSQDKRFTPSFTSGLLGLKLKRYPNSKIFSGFELR